jgi:ABC-2 type transport system ATP-binding protein
MDTVVLQSVCKVFRHRPAFFNWMGRERSGQTCALSDVTLTVQKGSVLVLLGPNGSGKTTTLKLVSTMLLPDQGAVLVEGLDTQTNAQAVRKHVGFAVAAERSFFPRLSARENLDFFAALENVPRTLRPPKIQSMLEQTGLQDSADTLVLKFSSGMYQRLGISRALIKEPTVILLDEPTRSLDPASAAHFWALVSNLKGQGATILLATHSFNEAAAVGDQITVLHRGKIAGRKRLAGVNVEELRRFYFDTTGEVDEQARFLAGSEP